MRKILFIILLCSFFLVNCDYVSEFQTTIPVTIKGSQLNIGADVYINHDACITGKRVLFVHGMSQNALTYKPLIQHLFDTSNNIRTAVAISMPARANSEIPTMEKQGYLLGDLVINDYRDIVKQVLSSGYFDEVVVHSLSGMTIQLVQNDLVANGSSLYQEYGITKVYLMAPVIPNEVSWFVVDSGLALELLSPYLVFGDTTYGNMLDIPIELTVGICYSRLDQTVVEGVPSVEDLTTHTTKESLTVVLDMASKPSITANIFKDKGTDLYLINFSQDWVFQKAEHEALYVHLTGDNSYSNFIYVVDNDAVHSTYVSKPELLGFLND